MSAYESLAACYDELTYDIPYEKTLTFFERLCAREHVQPHSVLDLACGTGSLSLLLARRGYRVIGADLSSDMLAEAEQKAQALPENRPFFICQPMQRLRLAEPVVSFLSELRQLAGASPAAAGRCLCVRARQPQLRDEACRLPEDLPPRL